EGAFLMHTTTRRRLAAIGVVAALTTPVAATVASPSAAAATSTAPYCGIRWGSLPKTAFVGDQWSGNIIRTRTGMHACYDRTVFDIAPGRGRISYEVSYVDQLIGLNGRTAPVDGGAMIQITIKAL